MRQHMSSTEHRPGSGPAPGGVVTFSAIVRGWLVLAGGPHRERGGKTEEGKGHWRFEAVQGTLGTPQSLLSLGTAQG